MEDFRHAYLERLQDKTLLESADRRTAAMHLGGVTIECLLKAMRVEIDHIADWYIPDEKCPAWSPRSSCTTRLCRSTVVTMAVGQSFTLGQGAQSHGPPPNKEIAACYANVRNQRTCNR